MSEKLSTLVKPGCLALLEKSGKILANRRVGILAHIASILPDCTYLFDRLLEDPSVKVTALFAPEHGLFGTAQDQVEIEQTSYRGVPVFSLYGAEPASLRPSEEALSLIDMLVVDLQDIGTRYYTYIYTLYHCLEACADAGVSVIVCDRPNPINGLTLEGPVLQEEFASFVGRYPMPVRHGLTIGELAQTWVSEKGWDVDLSVLPCDGWRRSQWFDQSGLPWAPPSPNMPTLSTAIVYPGGCLLEGTNLSEGRGTTRPFEAAGAPFLDGERLAELLFQKNLPGVTFRPVRFRPTFHKYAGQECGGVFVHVTDREKFRPFITYLELISECRSMASDDFSWRREVYEFESDRLAFDLLCGTDRIRHRIDAGLPLDELMQNWQNDISVFRQESKTGWLYFPEG